MNKVWLFILLSFVFLLFVGLISVVRGQKTSAESFFSILGNYTNKSVPLGGSLTVTPDSGASNIGSATISVSGNFKGSVTVSPTSGAIRVLNAYPAGTFTVTVRASDFAGFTLTRSFNLTVTNVSSCSTLDFTKAAATVENNPFGLILTADSKGLSGAIVKLTDENGAVRTVRSSSFGTFQFDEVEAGQNYILSVSSKRFQFTPRVISVSDNVEDLNLTANE
jgi:hypothetical protein